MVEDPHDKHEGHGRGANKRAAQAVDAPVIMQGSAGARSYAGESFLRHMISAAIEQLCSGLQR